MVADRYRGPVIAFTKCATDHDREKIKELVNFNYPGLMTHGRMDWDAIRQVRHKIAGGVSLDESVEILKKFNQHAQHQYDTDNPSWWPSNTELIRKWNTTSTGVIAEPTENTGRQAVFGPWDMMKEQFDIEPWKFFVLDMRRESEHPNAMYNVLLNIAMSTVLVGKNRECTYPLRFLLPKGWEDKLTTKKYDMSPKSILCAVVLVHYYASPEYLQSEGYGVPDRNPESFVPLFVYKEGKDPPMDDMHISKLYSVYSLVDIRGKRVDWGSHTDRMRITYYELRNVMAHLFAGTKVERRTGCWTMLRIDKTCEGDSKTEQYLVRKRHEDEEDEREAVAKEATQGLTAVFIDWRSGHSFHWSGKVRGSGIIIKPRAGTKTNRPNEDCVYEGAPEDMDRFGNHDERTQLDRMHGTAYFTQDERTQLDRMHGTAYFSNPSGAEPMQTESDSRLIDEGLDGVDGSSTFELPPDPAVMDSMMGKFSRRGDERSEVKYASILESWKTLSTEQMHPLNLLKAVVMSHYRYLVTRATIRSKARDLLLVQSKARSKAGLQNKRNNINQNEAVGRSDVPRWRGGGDGGRVMTGIACCLVIVFSALYETAAL